MKLAMVSQRGVKELKLKAGEYVYYDCAVNGFALNVVFNDKVIKKRVTISGTTKNGALLLYVE